MAPQRLVVEAAVLGWEDDEGDDSDVTGTGLKEMIESCQGLDEKVSALVAELVATCREEEQSLLEVEVDVSVEMSVDKVEDLLFVLEVKILELVTHSLHVQTVGSDDVRLPLDKVLRLLGRDVADRGEDVGEVGGGSLQAVSVVDLPLPGLHVHVEVLEVVVEVHGSGTEMSAQESGVSGEDRGHLHLPEPEHDEGDPGHPLVEMSQDLGGLLLAARHLPPEVGDELGHHEAEDDEVVTFSVYGRGPQLQKFRFKF